MARHSKDPEGDDTERRRRARAAREQGKTPSEAGVTRGASKQRAEVRTPPGGARTLKLWSQSDSAELRDLCLELRAQADGEREGA